MFFFAFSTLLITDLQHLLFLLTISLSSTKATHPKKKEYQKFINKTKF